MGIQGWGGLSGVGPHPLQLLPVPPASLMATLTFFLLAQLLHVCALLLPPLKPLLQPLH